MQRIEEIAAKALKRMGDDRYHLALLVAKRAEQLADGAVPLVEPLKDKMKFADLALYEIAEGKITLEGFIESSR